MNPRYLEYVQSESIGMIGVYLVVKEDMVSYFTIAQNSLVGLHLHLGIVFATLEGASSLSGLTNISN
ncbi:hypothetical protein H5410_054914 [Solanum commersonii]|uniref:Uncharacterized protein n=1 Tax=Solanum commersonii TaxID=4109 RepID=A0A9J5WHS5_SOLCO|nr:hypothetical protein H5410_054914 [Solanum commersonii]